MLDTHNRLVVRLDNDIVHGCGCDRHGHWDVHACRHGILGPMPWLRGTHDVGQPLGPAEHHPASTSFASTFSSKGGLCPMPAFVQSPMAKHVPRELLYPSAARACHRTCPETYHISTPGSSTIDRRRWLPEKLASSLVVSSWSSGQADTDQKSLTVSVGEPKPFATAVLGTVNFQRVVR